MKAKIKVICPHCQQEIEVESTVFDRYNKCGSCKYAVKDINRLGAGYIECTNQIMQSRRTAPSRKYANIKQRSQKCCALFERKIEE